MAYRLLQQAIMMHAVSTNVLTVCPRCHGFMVQTYSDLLDLDDKGEHVFYWRCVNCGEYMDPQVRQNRAAARRRTRIRDGTLRRPVAIHYSA